MNKVNNDKLYCKDITLFLNLAANNSSFLFISYIKIKKVNPYYYFFKDASSVLPVNFAMK